ncbi:hypothetical protein ACSMXN_15430 [Jatrophihabitans sp. DSM 45814]
MNAKKMLTSMIPWVVFSVIVEHGGTGTAGIAALLAAAIAIVLIIKDSRHGVKIIDAAGVITFVGLAILALGGNDAMKAHIADYGRGSSTLILAVVMLGSVLIVPFTEQYARESVPQQYWGSPVFRAVNRRISLVWGTAVLVMAGSHLLSGLIEANGNGTRGSNLLLNWAVPAALALAAIKYTNRVTSVDAPARPAVTR